MIFDGRAFAKEIEEQVRKKVLNLKVKPKIVSVLVGEDPASELYTRLKREAAERVGIDFEIVRFESGFSGEQNQDLGSRIKEIGGREDVTGLMIQLPIPGLGGEELKNIFSKIPLGKDVDGLRWEESKIKPASVRAILSIVDKIALEKKSFAVLGARGAVGRPLVHFLRERGCQTSEIDWDTKDPAKLTLESEVIISCVGKASLVTPDMIRDTSIVIDVGMSEVEGIIVGDMASEVYQKASIAVPVPRGVGPVTIASLMENIVDLNYGKTDRRTARA